ncbi:MAG: ABC transporter ATP-binding protein [Bacteroidia bacterium]|nr:ABC transporter ATP-binding protein [Bacteroidia bacterium]MDW8302446.1 ABC transporter ATP-binding protein [Bacteroidia bacterium]
MLQIQGLYKRYGNLEILKDIHFEIQKGEVVALVGASGAGKSTLLHLIAGLDKADSGQIIFEGVSISQLSSKEMAHYRNQKIGLIFQFHYLLPEFTALENVCIPAMIQGKSKKEYLPKAKEWLAYLGLSERMNHKPSQLSGGEQQRVAVARALINNPKLILADEPSGNLDSANAQHLHSLFFQLSQEFGQTFLIATHNPELAAQSHRILHIKDGKITS